MVTVADETSAPVDFDRAFQDLTGNEPFPWQRAMYERFAANVFPPSASLPTGLGKTNVIAVWLIALANHPGHVPRRLVYVVNRRTVVDQSTDVVKQLRDHLVNPQEGELPKLASRLRGLTAIVTSDGPVLAISTLRGQAADNREWSADPARPAVIAGTVDMIGSRLLFSGYGVGFKSKPLHAGFLGNDVLLVHDEAHLEPAFQDLVVAIQNEPRPCAELGRFRVMELTATSRGGGETFELTDDENRVPAELPTAPVSPLHHVWQRLAARKGVKLRGVGRGAVAKTIGEMALGRKESGQAVLVFVRTVDDVKVVREVLTDRKKGVLAAQVEVLTGTLRGKERDALASESRVFARFQPTPKVDQQPGTVFLICTSAGEVGVDISAGHMVSDLTPLDSMAQRLGRVNRRGGGQAEVDVVYETDPKDIDKPYEQARWATKTHLEALPPCEWAADRQEGSPQQVGKLIRELSAEQRKAAFAPEPVILATSDILFDAWALTTVRDTLPGRPKVEPYLHGVTDRDPPETFVAWRREVDELDPEFEEDDTDVERHTRRKAFEKFAAEILENYPVKPHELLREPSHRASKSLAILAEKHPDKRVWLLDDDGTVQLLELGDLRDLTRKDRVEGMTVLLPPSAGGLAGGFLDGSAPATDGGAEDVADDWKGPDGVLLRKRVKDGSTVEEGWREVQSKAIKESEDGEPLEILRWLVRQEATDEAGAAGQPQPYPLDQHNVDAGEIAAELVARLRLPADMAAAVTVAARAHDLGKDRDLWQRSIGNGPPRARLAKSGHRRRPEQVTHYRHEFGSMLDVATDPAFQELSPDMRELCLHLIAAHHGRGRPHFPPDEAFDPERSAADAAATAAAVPRRFARLQRKYGRWGLAYLESLVRAADVLASRKAEGGAP